MPQMSSDSFSGPGVDIWSLEPTGERRTVRVETVGDMELNALPRRASSCRAPSSSSIRLAPGSAACPR